MDVTERRARLAALVRERGFVRVADAAEALAVSTVTVRGDLSALEASGALSRVHGGAVPTVLGAEESIESTIAARAEAKRTIGETAAGLVRSGQTVLVDVGSTALAVAHALVARTELADVTVVTNGLSTALALEAAVPRLTVVVTGGTLRPLQHSLVDPFVSPALAELTFDLAIVGCTGVDPEFGVSNVNLAEAAVKRRMLAQSTRAVVIADGSKLGRRDHARVVELDGVDTLVTAGDAPAGVLDRIRAAGVEVLGTHAGR